MNNLSNYLQKIRKELAAGNATEETHRTALKELIESFATGITATNEPKRIACGAPDFIITRRQVPLGYIETKDIGKSLDEAEKSEQLKRYREALGNLILTDYLEFRWYVRGERRLVIRLADIGGKHAMPEAMQQVTELFNNFLMQEIPTVENPKELAQRMASLARLIRDTIQRTFQEEPGEGTLHQQYEGLK